MGILSPTDAPVVSHGIAYGAVHQLETWEAKKKRGRAETTHKKANPEMPSVTLDPLIVARPETWATLILSGRLNAASHCQCCQPRLVINHLGKERKNENRPAFD